jgi:hypothetical protein
MRPVRALPTPLMRRGQLLHGSCRPQAAHPRQTRPALKERAAAPARGITPSIITSPDHQSVHQDKAGRPRARPIPTPPHQPVGEVVTVR